MTDEVQKPAVAVRLQRHVRQHTPGPWSTKFAKTAIQVMSVDGRVVATVHPGREDKQDAARLIAAAPELLAALQALRLAREQDKYPSWEKGVPEFNKAEALADAAIDKAVGRAA